MAKLVNTFIPGISIGTPEPIGRQVQQVKPPTIGYSAHAISSQGDFKVQIFISQCIPKFLEISEYNAVFFLPTV
jgi:hypothetical protein